VYHHPFDMKRTFDDTKRELAEEEVLQVMVQDSIDEAGRKAKRAKLVRELINNPLYEPLFEERWGDLVRRGRLPTLYYNHPDVTPATDVHPLRDIWSIILGFQRRLYFKQRWLEGRIQIFSTHLIPYNKTMWDFEAVESAIYLKFHYNKAESVGVFAQWHNFLRETRDWKTQNDIREDTISKCRYWSTASGKVHEWESLQTA